MIMSSLTIFLSMKYLSWWFNGIASEIVGFALFQTRFKLYTFLHESAKGSKAPFSQQVYTGTAKVIVSL